MANPNNLIRFQNESIFGIHEDIATLESKGTEKSFVPEEIEEDEIQNRIAICKTCPHHTYGEIKAGEITEYGKYESEIIRRIGNAINALGEDKLRCKKCGCFATAKAGGGGRIVDKLTFGHYGNKCPDKGPDGLTNWERGHILKSDTHNEVPNGNQ